MVLSAFPPTSQTVPTGFPSVNSLLPMETRGARLRRFLIQQTGGQHGWVNALAERSGVKRQTLSAWMGDRAEPTMESLTDVARALDIPRYRIIAAMDGDAVLPLDEEGTRKLEEMLDRLLEDRGFRRPPGDPGTAR